MDVLTASLLLKQNNTNRASEMLQIRNINSPDKKIKNKAMLKEKLILLNLCLHCLAKICKRCVGYK